MVLTRHFFHDNWEESTHGLMLQDQHISENEFEYLIEDGNMPVKFGRHKFSIIMIMHDLQLGQGKAIWRIESYDFETKELLVHYVNSFEKCLVAFDDFERAFTDAGHRIEQPSDYEENGGMERGILERLRYHMEMNMKENREALAKSMNVSFN